MKTILLMIGMVLLLTACAGSEKNTRPQAWLKPGVKMTLPPPSITPSIHQQQLLTATVKGQQHQLLVLLSADEQRLTLAGLSPLGIRLFRLTYDSSGISAEQSMMLPQLPPTHQVLADIMLSYWPLSAWHGQLPAGWTLTDQDDRRELWDSNRQRVIKILYRTLPDGQRQPISVHQYPFDYQISIQSLDSGS